MVVKKLQLKRYFKYHYFKIVRVKDTPDKVAKGVGLGIALNFSFLPLISIPISYFLAWILGFNRLAAVSTTVISKWLVPFFWYLNYYVGSLVLGQPNQQSKIPHAEGINGGIEQFFNKFIVTIKGLGPAFFVGNAIDSLVFGLLFYFLIKQSLKYRLEKRKNKKKKNKAICQE